VSSSSSFKILIFNFTLFLSPAQVIPGLPGRWDEKTASRPLAEALAQAAGLKSKSVDKISTMIRIIATRGPGEPYPMARPSPASPTPIEAGEAEIMTHIQAVFLVTP
jgi:uncharacterized protein YggE